MLLYVTLLCSAFLLTDYGWQTNSDGELEYIIQIEPELLDSLRGGEEIVSEIPPELKNVRRVRIRVGTQPVPRVGASVEAEDSAPAPSDTLRSLPPPPSSRTDAAPVAPADDEPPPLLGGGGSFRPPSPPGAFRPSGSSDRPEPASRSESAYPIKRSKPSDLQPIPREGAVSDSMMGRLSTRLDAQVRPATAAEPVGNDRSKQSEDESESKARASGAEPVSNSQTTSETKVGEKATVAAPISDPRPWLPFLLTSLALFASIGLNIYLGWITFGAVQRYRELAAKGADANGACAA